MSKKKIFQKKKKKKKKKKNKNGGVFGGGGQFFLKRGGGGGRTPFGLGGRPGGGGAVAPRAGGGKIWRSVRGGGSRGPGSLQKPPGAGGASGGGGGHFFSGGYKFLGEIRGGRASPLLKTRWPGQLFHGGKKNFLPAKTFLSPAGRLFTGTRGGGTQQTPGFFFILKTPGRGREGPGGCFFPPGTTKKKWTKPIRLPPLKGKINKR